MRLAVLDIGSNTGHLLVVDAHRGAAPSPAHSYKEPLRLAEHLEEDDTMSGDGIAALTEFVRHSVAVAEDKGCQETLAFATSAVREATNTEAVLDTVAEQTGVTLSVLAGEEEAVTTFLAVRRWFGWSAGRLNVFDIGGGSLEIAGGHDEAPDVAWSVPLGAARLARDWLGEGHGPDETKALRRHIRSTIARDAGTLLRTGRPDRAAGTSKTFRSLARICGAAPSGDGPLVPRVLKRQDIVDRIPDLTDVSLAELAGLPGVSASRAHQILPGALVAEAVMDLFEVESLEICPWALREGMILQRFDSLDEPGEQE